jgi:hypothetical protein
VQQYLMSAFFISSNNLSYSLVVFVLSSRLGD